jgi:acetone carboxylase gamma subunit
MGFTAGVPVENLGWYSRCRYPDPIVPRALVREVRERVDQAGRVLVPLDEELELREFACTECGTLLELEVARRGQDSIATIVLDCS